MKRAKNTNELRNNINKLIKKYPDRKYICINSELLVGCTHIDSGIYDEYEFYRFDSSKNPMEEAKRIVEKFKTDKKYIEENATDYGSFISMRNLEKYGYDVS